MKKYFFIIFLTFITSILAYNNSKNLTDENLTKINNREIVFIDDSDNGTPGVTAYFLLNAPRKKIWKAITDYDNFPVYFPDVKEAKVLNEFKGGVTLAITVDSAVKTFHYIALRKYTVPFKEVNWDQISGDFKVNKGAWEILDSGKPDSYIIRYSSFVELDSIMGKTLARLTRKGSKDRVVNLVKKMRELLEK